MIPRTRRRKGRGNNVIYSGDGKRILYEIKNREYVLGFKWKKDKESCATVKIISEAGEEIGEIKFSFNNQKQRA